MGQLRANIEMKSAPGTADAIAAVNAPEGKALLAEIRAGIQGLEELGKEHAECERGEQPAPEGTGDDDDFLRAASWRSCCWC